MALRDGQVRDGTCSTAWSEEAVDAEPDEIKGQIKDDYSERDESSPLQP